MKPQSIADVNSENSLESYLELQGFDVLMCRGSCPFQICANHKSGISTYFRSRHETAYVEIYSELFSYTDDSLPSDESIIWDGKFMCWKDPSAGYLQADEVFYVFYLLWSDAKDYVLD